MGEVRDATVAETDLLVQITATGFYDDPVMRWVFPDDAARRGHLEVMFGGLVRDYLPDRGTVHVLAEACASFWRSPSFPHGRTAAERARDAETDQRASPFPDEAMERLGILGSAMQEAHPHEPHWYLNVVSTRPERQGQGLGAQTLEPVLVRCDVEGVPAYLESTNPRNVPFYRRLGFEPTAEIRLPGGPTLTTMWRDPVPDRMGPAR